MYVRFKSRVIVDPVTVAKPGDELDIAIPVARELIAQNVAEPADPLEYAGRVEVGRGA
jgi:hypothetical protein